MTITNQTVKQSFTGDGSNQSFAIPFAFQLNAEITVYLRDETIPSAITQTLLTLSVDYTLTGGPPVTTVHMAVAPTSTQKVVMIRATAKNQQTSYQNLSSFPAASHESALDKLTQEVQELNLALQSAILLPLTTTLSGLTYANPVAYGYLRWNSGANGVENPALIATTPLVWTPSTSTFSMPQANGSVNGFLSNIDWTTFNSKQSAGTPAVSATELGYLKGATSNIQTQINNIITGNFNSVTGSPGAPTLISAGGQIPVVSGALRQVVFISGNAGAVSTGAPHIQAGVTTGQELKIVGCDGTNTVTVTDGDGTGTDGDGDMVHGLRSISKWLWDGTRWCEEGRNGL